MNPANFGSLPTNACTLGVAGTGPNDFGPDRIKRHYYNVNDHLVKIQKAYGTSDQQDYATFTVDAYGKQTSITDANFNLSTMEYDGFNRLIKWNFPSKTTIRQISASDYEQYGYDAVGNRTSIRKRDGSVLTYQYDNLNRNTVKFVPERAGLAAMHTRDVYYGYDLRGLQTYARFDSASGNGLTTVYDGFGRQTGSTLVMDGISKTLAFQHDPNGNRTRLQWVNDGGYASYSYDGLNRLKSLFKSAGWTNELVGFAYNNRGLPSAHTGKYTQATTFGYGSVGRLNALMHDFTGTLEDVTYSFAYNPANQITERITGNDAYVWTGGVNTNRTYTVNGLNQYTSAGGTAFAYDDNGNLTQSGGNSYTYDIENRLVGMSGGSNASLRYDPLGRLYQVTSIAGATRFLYDGDELVSGIGWVETKALKPGMAVETRTGFALVVTRVTQTSRTSPTFNLTVAEFNTYFVGKQKVWVHNACRTGEFGKQRRNQILTDNREKNGGKPTCEDCRRDDLVSGVANQRGIPTPANQVQVHHNPPISKSGGKNSKGEVLCPSCHKRRPEHKK